MIAFICCKYNEVRNICQETLQELAPPPEEEEEPQLCERMNSVFLLCWWLLRSGCCVFERISIGALQLIPIHAAAGREIKAQFVGSKKRSR